MSVRVGMLGLARQAVGFPGRLARAAVRVASHHRALRLSQVERLVLHSLSPHMRTRDEIRQAAGISAVAAPLNRLRDLGYVKVGRKPIAGGGSVPCYWLTASGADRRQRVAPPGGPGEEWRP